MKANYVRQRLDEMGKDSDWLADQVGVAPVTMRQNYLRGITPQKPVALMLKKVLNCEFKDFLYDEEIDALSLNNEAS